MDQSIKHVWIIGASSGIGAALAKNYDQNGWRVTASARNAEALDDLASSGHKISSLVMDVQDAGAFDHAIAQFNQTGSLPDLVIFSAATYRPGGLGVLTHKDANNHMATNYLAAVGLIEAITPEFTKRGHGHLAIIASLSGYCGLPNAALYGPTKAALINLCETLKPDYDQLGLKLSLINPGFVKTPMTDKNSFSMPFLLSPEQAADKISTGLARGKFEIAFPWPLSISLKILQKMPYALYFKLTKRLAS
ncbi:SDR family NAD(P)-dependent oxidoreductase [Cohaesibacter celericrescens]|uniref:SDR family NAD(P)-dependent oxidoreductase n=1 Tax=Cohaesibacter celericrescens TaxID=2067669 RepID=UPI0035658682